jgi:hypothetical protein
MVPCGQRSLVRRSPGVLAALLAGLLCGPAAARAGCDHRPFLGDGPGEVKLPGDPAKPAAPCQGPGCSRGPSQAPATPPAPAPREVKPGAAQAVGPLPADAGPASRLYPLPCLSPVRHTADIFHPPRLSPAAPAL